MDGSDDIAGVGSGDGSELCDECGVLAPLRDMQVLWMPDSSAVDMDPRFDGERLLRACGKPHLVRLAAAYRHRPFVLEELWAGQITRAVRLLGPLVDEAEMYDRMVAMTGLDDEQVMRAVAWQDSHDHPSGRDPG